MYAARTESEQRHGLSPKAWVSDCFAKLPSWCDIDSVPDPSPLLLAASLATVRRSHPNKSRSPEHLSAGDSGPSEGISWGHGFSLKSSILSSKNHSTQQRWGYHERIHIARPASCMGHSKRVDERRSLLGCSSSLASTKNLDEVSFGFGKAKQPRRARPQCFASRRSAHHAQKLCHVACSQHCSFRSFKHTTNTCYIC